MINKPLNSSEQTKIYIFILLSVILVVLSVGVIPALFLGFGIFMLKKYEDFSHIETAVRNAKASTILLAIAWIFLLLFLENEPHYEFIPPTVVGAFLYIIVLNFLFYEPLKAHSKWIEKNDIFSLKSKSETSEIDIIKGKQFRQYSVADELLKWNELLEKEAITQAEYDKAKRELLG